MSVGDAALIVLMAASTAVVALPRARIGRRGAELLSGTAALAGVVAVAWLIRAFAVEDWSNEYVVEHTRRGLAWPIRLAGLWGGAEGSLLLWTSFTAVAAFAALLLGADRRISAVLPAAYGAVVLLVVNPFTRLAAPEPDGLGLQPVLEHPAMAWHPPILYAGLTGLLVPTLLAVSGVSVSRQRRTTLVALAFLTIGLVTGAGWAHAELGWGGYWAWDPIESAGLVAWLAGAATLHLLDRPSSPAAALPGLSAVWATTLTRTGLVSSVHAFADRPNLRVALLVIAFGWTAVLVMFMISAAGSDDWSRSTDDSVTVGRRTGSLVLVAAGALVALGTYEPAIERALGGDAAAIAGRYFVLVTWPLVVLGAIAAIIADDHKRAALLGAILGLLTVPLSAGPFGVAVGAAGGAVAASALAGAPRRRGWLAHAGVGVLLVGVGGTVATEIAVESIRKGETIEAAGAQVTHNGIELVEDENSTRAVAAVDIDGRGVTTEIVVHQRRRVSTAEVGTVRGFLDETQVVLRDGTDDVATYQVGRFPRLHLVWGGSSLIAVGLVLAAVPSGLVARIRQRRRSGTLRAGTLQS